MVVGEFTGTSCDAAISRGLMERGQWEMERGQWEMERGQWEMERGQWERSQKIQNNKDHTPDFCKLVSK